MSGVIDVEVPDASYRVHVGSGLLSECGALLRGVSEAKMVALVSDEGVAAHYATAVDISLARAGYKVASFTVPAGETSKSWALAGDLLEQFAQFGVGREDVVVALGGGVVGDLAGFAAATYLRGIAFAQIPTTLLAMVDSSVGGKTGVDLRAGKNLAGAFKQPLIVIADTDSLSTLPDREWRSGLAEVAKTAVLSGDEFMDWLMDNEAAISSREEGAVREIVTRCVAFKAGVVSRDEKEEGPRECLNYGHTLGHALEKVLGYGTVTHGEAVAEGMRFVSRVAVEVGQAETAFVKRQDRLLDALGLPSLDVFAEPTALLSAMRSDKKVRARAIRMVLADGPGLWRCVAVDDGILGQHLEAWAATKGEV